MPSLTYLTWFGLDQDDKDEDATQLASARWGFRPPAWLPDISVMSRLFCFSTTSPLLPFSAELIISNP